MGEPCDMCGGEEKCMQGFGGETERNRPFARSRSIWEDNIKLMLKKWDW